MSTKIAIMTSTIAALVLTSGIAMAQEKPYWREPVQAPAKAFELTVGTGYTQGIGKLERGLSMASVATPGAAVELGAGYRIDSHFSLGVVGEFHELRAERTTAVRGGMTGAQVAYHFDPTIRSDPWVQFGAGYRVLCECDDTKPNLTRHGLDFARLTAGFDLRLSRELALGPMVGADLNVFLWQTPQNGSMSAIGDPRVNTFVFAGIQGRLDVGGWEENVTQVAGK